MAEPNKNPKGQKDIHIQLNTKTGEYHGSTVHPAANGGSAGAPSSGGGSGTAARNPVPAGGDSVRGILLRVALGIIGVCIVSAIAGKADSLNGFAGLGLLLLVPWRNLRQKDLPLRSPYILIVAAAAAAVLIRNVSVTAVYFLFSYYLADTIGFVLLCAAWKTKKNILFLIGLCLLFGYGMLRAYENLFDSYPGGFIYVFVAASGILILLSALYPRQKWFPVSAAFCAAISLINKF